MDLESTINYILNFFTDIFGNEKCIACNNKVRCSSNQFIKGQKDIFKCSQCKRSLESIRNKNRGGS